MACFFSDDDLKRLGEARVDVEKRYDRLQTILLTRQFKSERAVEYCRQGLARRLDEMSRTIKFVFEILPPEQEAIPQRDERIAATMLLQSYFMNVQGCIDNIAWVWVFETNQKGPDGGEIRRGLVGLGKQYRYLMKSFSCSFRSHVRGLRKWFEHVAEFRDSTAHRIPLYVPPYFIVEAHKAEYKRLGREAMSALAKGDTAAYDKHRKDQDALGMYRPIMSHSPVEGSPGCVFHAQILRDFTTIDEIAQKLFEEIDAFGAQPEGWLSCLKSRLGRTWPFGR